MSVVESDKESAKESLRKKLKEWGEVADVWTKVGVRLGFFGVAMFSGGAIVNVLQKLLS